MKGKPKVLKYKNGSPMGFLGSHGTVDFEKAIESILFRIEDDVVDVDFVNKSAEKGVIYFNNKGIALDTENDKEVKEVKYKVIPLGYTDKLTGYELCASFLVGHLGWEGIFTGTLLKLIERMQTSYLEKIGQLTPEEIASRMIYANTFEIRGKGLRDCLKYNEDKLSGNQYITFTLNAEENTVKNENSADTSREETEIIEFEYNEVQKKSDVYVDIYNRLLIKENWKKTQKNRLRNYVRSLLERVAYDQKQSPNHRGNGYITSNDYSICIINTGLIDSFNNDIYILDNNNMQEDFTSKEITLCPSKSWLVNLGFNRDDIKIMPKPIKFYNNKSELIFNASIEEIDVEDDYRLEHIIRERLYRFPAEYQNMSSDIICDKLKTAINKAVRLSERDFKYIVPMYNLKAHKIQYLMPLHLNKSIEDVPELVAVVGEDNGFYCVYTILEPDDAYDNARLLCRPDSNWLRI